MKRFNIYEQKDSQLEVHTDERGTIADVFFSANINHVALINSKASVIRGNHYHRESVQSILIIRGCLEYWYKQADTEGEPQYVLATVGDVITSDPLEIHTLKIGAEGCDFIAFTTGKRGGRDYESDTYRVKSII